MSGALARTAERAEMREGSAPTPAVHARIPALAGHIVHSKAKRLTDIVVAVGALAVLLPVVVFAALAVRLTSPGPVLFRQPRVGLGGVRFTVLKFRTMRHAVSDEKHRRYVQSMVASSHAAEAQDGAFKLVRDDRVTSVGRFLRRTSLDELPQLWNVLKGEMSVVGPRPPLDYEVALYEPWQLERLTVRPGLTGLWQVSGRNNMTYYHMCVLDVEYVRGWSLQGDLRIIARTPWVMVSNSGKAA